MKEIIICERKKIRDKCNYGIYNKSIAKNIGLEAAVVLDYLLARYDYNVGKLDKYKLINGRKAFFITQRDLFSNTFIKSRRFLAPTRINPFVRLEKKGLIKRVVLNENNIQKTYFILNFKTIDKATN